MSPTPPSPSWPIPSAVALGNTNEEFPELIVPLVYDDESHIADITIPNNTSWNRIDFAVPDGVPADGENNQEWPFEITSYGVIITPTTALSDLQVGIQVSVDGGTEEYWGVNITFE